MTNAHPSRIVSLQPSVTVILDRLNSLDLLVACTPYCQAVCAEVNDGSRLIVKDSWISQSAEILAAQPDLVIASVPYQAASIAEILKSGTPVLALAPHSLAIKDDLPRVVVYVVVFRLFELAQVYGNLLLFLRLRRNVSVKMHSAARRLLLAFTCYVELAVLFGLLYWQFRSHLQGILAAPADAFYFSVATMATVGFGDIVATGWLRLLVAGQVLVGFFFAIGLLGRFVSLLPAADTSDR